MGLALCEVALETGLPSITAPSVPNERKGEVCACVSAGFAKQSNSVFKKLEAELATSFAEHKELDRQLGDWFADCAPSNEEGEGEGDMGDAYIHYLQSCEAAVDGDDLPTGLKLGPLRKAMSAQGHSKDSLCSCAADTMLSQSAALEAAILSPKSDGTEYGVFLTRSMTTCADKAPHQRYQPDFNMPAYDYCHAHIETVFPGGALNAWRRGSGLEIDDICSCVGSGAIDTDLGADATDVPAEVLRAGNACMNILWKP